MCLVTSSFVYSIELAEVHFCSSDVYNDDYLNVSALLSKKGNEGASDQVFKVLSYGHYTITVLSHFIASLLDKLFVYFNFCFIGLR